MITSSSVWQRRTTHLAALTLAVLAIGISFFALWGRSRRRVDGGAENVLMSAQIREQAHPATDQVETATFALG